MAGALIGPAFGAWGKAVASRSGRAFFARAVAATIRVAPTCLLLLLQASIAASATGGGHARQIKQGLGISWPQLHPLAATQAARQVQGAVADADQAADGMPQCLEHAADFAVAAFADGDAVPAIGAFTAAFFDMAEMGGAVFQLDAGQQALLLFFAQCAQHPRSVFALQAEAGVHELVGQLTRVGDEQQPFGIEVQPTHGLPFALR